MTTPETMSELERLAAANPPTRSRALPRLMARHGRLLVLLATLLGVLLRLFVVLAIPPEKLIGDERLYRMRATKIVNTGDPGNALQPPGQPYLMAATRLVLSDDPVWSRLINIAFYLIAVVALVSLTPRWSRALPAVVVFSLHPVWVGFSALLWNECVFVGLLFSAIALQRRRGWVLTGVVWGLAALTRQIAIPFFVVWAGFEVIGNRWSRQSIQRIALISVVMIVTVSPWLIRNYREFGRAVFTTSTGFNLWAGNQRDVDPPYSWQYRKFGSYIRYRRDFGSNDLERDEECARRGLAFIREEMPSWLIRRPWMGISHLFEPDNFVLMKMRFGNYGELKAPVRWLTIAFTMGGEYLVIGWSTWMLLSLRPSRQRNAVLAMFAFGVGTHIFTVVHSRHRLVLELVLLLAAGGRYKPRDARRAWLAVGLVALIITIGLLSPGRAQLIDAITGVLSVRG